MVYTHVKHCTQVHFAVWYYAILMQQQMFWLFLTFDMRARIEDKLTCMGVSAPNCSISNQNLTGII